MSEELYDTLGPLEGYRLWATVLGTLAAVGDLSYTWNPDGPTKARCRWNESPIILGNPVVRAIDRHRDLPAPQPKCSCGLYLAKTLDVILPPPAKDLQNDLNPTFVHALRTGQFVAGTAKVWGTVIPHRRGYRAEYARPTGLYPLWDERMVPIAQEEPALFDLEESPPLNVVMALSKYDLPVLELPESLTWLTEVYR